MIRNCFLISSLLFACAPVLADSGESEFGLVLEKLEHLFRYDASTVEVEATYGNDDSFFAIKSENGFDSGSYDFSETQLYYTRSLGGRASGIVGARHLDLDSGGGTSPMVGVAAGLAFDIEILALAFFDDELTEGRFEVARTFELSPRMELEPKIEMRAYSNDAESVALELRLGYAATDCLKAYVGTSWFRVAGTPGGDNEFSALAGLSYEW